MADESLRKHPCCLLLKKTATRTSSVENLKNPDASINLLQTVCANCIMMQTLGHSNVKFDFKKEIPECYLLVSPESAQALIDEVSKTISVEQLDEYLILLAKVYAILAQHPKADQIKAKFNAFLAELRNHESRFGKVPYTSMLTETTRHSLESGDLLQQHPLLSSPQFDGVSDPKSNPDTKQNPAAAEEANRLQNQHRPKPGFNPRPAAPGGR